MLAPEQRSNYTDALRPPPGWRLDHAVAATYSLDLTTLLTFPLHLALIDAGRDSEVMLEDGVALLEALRRTTSNLTVFCHRGQILAPSIPRVLFSLLEPVVVEAQAPMGGAFHAKFWLLRFVAGDDLRLRLVVPTRNITNDRCWDLVLTLEGTPGKRGVAANRGLREMLQALPQMALRPLAIAAAERLKAITAEAYNTAWELPDDFDEVQFHTLGLRTRMWLPPESRRLVVISPFLARSALVKLVETSDDPVALISRPEDMAMIPADILESFDQLSVLHEGTAPDDAEESASGWPPQHGLHAKAYIIEEGSNTHAFIGSANATNAGLSGQNLEILVELIGRRRKLRIDDLLSLDALGAVLTDFAVPDAPTQVDPAVHAAKQALLAAQRSLAAAGLRVSFTQADDDSWAYVLSASAPVELHGIGGAIAWPVTLKQATSAVNAMPLAAGEAISWKAASVASLTGFIAFELTAEAANEVARMVFNVPVDGLPFESREAAILRSILSNREGFLRYLLLLLGEDDSLFTTGIGEGEGESSHTAWTYTDGLPLLEELSRALHRDPQRLDAVKRIVHQLGHQQTDDGVVPPEFLQLWAAFEKVIGELQL